MVCKLKRSLYRLKQALRQWYLKFDMFTSETRHKRCDVDHSCYHKAFDARYIILLLYMDDILLTDSSIHEINNLKKQLSKEFEMKNLGIAKQILRMRITRDGKNYELRLSQQSMLKRCLANLIYKMQKPISYSLASHF